jgi:hypothetical protein
MLLGALATLLTTVAMFGLHIASRS